MSICNFISVSQYIFKCETSDRRFQKGLDASWHLIRILWKILQNFVDTSSMKWGCRHHQIIFSWLVQNVRGAAARCTTVLASAGRNRNSDIKATVKYGQENINYWCREQCTSGFIWEPYNGNIAEEKNEEHTTHKLRASSTIYKLLCCQNRD